MNEWIEKKEWWKRGNNFLVTINHYCDYVPVEYNTNDNGNRWNVYCYIYPNHKIFNKFTEDTIFQDVCNKLPLHCGASLFNKYYDKDGNCLSIKIGSDYNHLYDDEFNKINNFEDAYIVVKDALKLFEYLSST